MLQTIIFLTVHQEIRYAVFGKVVKGMDVVDRIVQAPTSNYGMHQNVPKQPIKIVDIKIKNSQK